MPTIVRTTRQGVSASCVALPSQQVTPWRTTLDFLVDRFPAISRETWAARMSVGELSNEAGECIDPLTPFTPHQKIYYYRGVADEPHIPFAATIVFQDEHIVVADKPHFLPVTPAGRFVQETLLVRLKRQLGLDDLSPAHRIDRETAGLVLFTIHPQSRDAYQRLFRDRAVEKRYEAIAAIPPAGAQHIFPLTRRSRLVESETFMRMHEVPGEANAESHIDLIETQGALARYELRPVTGKKHQLRAHMAALGIPIVNDRIYPNLRAVEADVDFQRPLRLLAKELVFTDPFSGRARQFLSDRRLTILETELETELETDADAAT